MSATIDTLVDFYQTPRGQLVRRAITRAIVRTWPLMQKENVLGLGYTAPFVPVVTAGNNVFLCATQTLGAAPWPCISRNNVVLSDDAAFPYLDESMSRVLVVHALESADQPKKMMREIWRVLTYQGRALVIVPNRWGLWSHTENTPFGHGKPYTPPQLKSFLEKNHFTVKRLQMLLYTPPTESMLVMDYHHAFEKWGYDVFYRFGGLVAIEVCKEALSPIPARGQQVPRVVMATG